MEKRKQVTLCLLTLNIEVFFSAVTRLIETAQRRRVSSSCGGVLFRVANVPARHGLHRVMRNVVVSGKCLEQFVFKFNSTLLNAN